MARRVNLNASVMNRIESGERPIKDHELDEIASALDVTADYILGRSSDPRLTEKQDIELDKKTRDLLKKIDRLPENKRDYYISRIEAYVDGLTHAEEKGDD